MKTLKVAFYHNGSCCFSYAGIWCTGCGSDIPVTEQPGVSPTPSPVPIRELVTKGNKIYYYYKGKMVKNKWKRYNGYKYYFGANGNAVRGGQRINNVVYVFDEKGRLFENKQNKIVNPDPIFII